ncbi:MAG: zf-HC2 domain-containing protein [Burkholderiales bacterium]|nr:zf-HC2 domain-containing protein [Burkholderiales bacterium]
MNCPPFEELSAYADQMLASAAQQRLASHVQTCAHCQAQLQSLRDLQLQLHALPQPHLGFDLGERRRDQLQTAGEQRKRAPRLPAWGWAGWMPAGLAAAAMVSGVWLGALLVGGGMVGTVPVGAVRVFDPVPPGGLCAAAELCRATKGMP